MGDASADRLRYEQWVRLYARQLYQYAYRLSGDHGIAEDLVQECFAEAWKCIAKQREPDKARAWLFTILRHRFARQFRRKIKTVTLPEDSEQHPSAGQDPAERLEDREMLQRGLMSLSIEQRQALLMVFVEQLSCRETASTLGIPLGTVLSRLDSARRALRSALGMPQRVRRGGTPPKVLR